MTEWTRLSSRKHSQCHHKRTKAKQMFGDRVRQAREFCGMTQSELAEKSGLRQSAIAQIEAGAFTPSDAAIQAIAIPTGFEIAFFKQDKAPAEFPFGSF